MKNIIPPPPNFTVGIMHWAGSLLASAKPKSDCQMVKRESVFYTAPEANGGELYTAPEANGGELYTAPEANGGELYTAPADAWHCTWRSATETPFMKLPTNSSGADIASRGSWEDDDRLYIFLSRYHFGVPPHPCRPGNLRQKQVARNS